MLKLESVRAIIVADYEGRGNVTCICSNILETCLKTRFTRAATDDYNMCIMLCGTYRPTSYATQAMKCDNTYKLR